MTPGLQVFCIIDHLLPEVELEVFVFPLEMNLRVKVITLDCLKAMIFGANDLFIKAILYILAS